MNYKLEQTGEQVQELLNQVTPNEEAISDTQGKIPEAASPENQLADKSYVERLVSNEESRAKAAEKANADDIDALEQAVGTGGSVDTRIANAVAGVVGDAGSDYNTLGKLEDKLQEEEERAKAAEKANADDIDLLEQAVGTGGSVDERIGAAVAGVVGDAASDYNTLGKLEEKLQEEVTRAETAEGTKANSADVYTKAQVDDLITTPDVNYVSVLATNATTAVTDVLPATGAADTIYRVGNWDGTQYDATMYSLYAWNGSAYLCLAVRSFIGEVYDISANHPDGQGNPTTYADLAAALGTSGSNVPAGIRRGGMSVKFIQTSDNKYVQYRLTKDEWSVNFSDWQGVDDKPTAGSHNLVESDGVAESINSFIEETNSIDYTEVLIDNTNKILESRDSTGKKTVHVDTEFNSNVIINGNITGKHIPEVTIRPGTNLVDAVIDEDNKVVEGTRKNGAKVFFGGIETKDGVPFKTSILYGKKWAVLGDSFTNGGSENGVITEEGKYKGSRCTYPWIIGNRTGIEVVKFFEGGRTLAYPSDGTFHNSVCDPNAACYYQNIPEDVDYITIYLGINDSQHVENPGSGDGEDYTGVIPLGTINDETTATYYGAWNVVLTWLLEHRPFAHIGIIICNGLSQSNISWVEAQIAIAEKYGVPYINLNGDRHTPAMIRSINTHIPTNIKNIINTKQRVSSSNTHPNRNAHIFESTFIENFLISL